MWAKNCIGITHIQNKVVPYSDNRQPFLYESRPTLYEQSNWNHVLTTYEVSFTKFLKLATDDVSPLLLFIPIGQPDPWYIQGLAPFLVEFPGTAKLTFFIWHLVVFFLSVVIALAQFAYRNNRNPLYRYYQLYAGLLLIFILSRNGYWFEFIEKYGEEPIRTFGFLIQTLYLCVYFRFGILFLKLDKHLPVFTRWIFGYTAV